MVKYLSTVGIYRRPATAVLQCSQLTAAHGWGFKPQPSLIKDIFSTREMSLDVHIRSTTMIFEMQVHFLSIIKPQ